MLGVNRFHEVDIFDCTLHWRNGIKNPPQVDAMGNSMSRNRDEKTGQYTESYPPEEFLSAINSLDEAASTQQIADEVGCAYRTAHAELTKLEEEENITSRKVGNAKLWE